MGKLLWRSGFILYWVSASMLVNGHLKVQIRYILGISIEFFVYVCPSNNDLQGCHFAKFLSGNCLDVITSRNWLFYLPEDTVVEFVSLQVTELPVLVRKDIGVCRIA